MIDLLRRVFHPHQDSAPPKADVSTNAERRRLERRKADVLARLELLRVETDVIAARAVRDGMDKAI